MNEIKELLLRLKKTYIQRSNGKIHPCELTNIMFYDQGTLYIRVQWTAEQAGERHGGNKTVPCDEFLRFQITMADHDENKEQQEPIDSGKGLDLCVEELAGYDISKLNEIMQVLSGSDILNVPGNEQLVKRIARKLLGFNNDETPSGKEIKDRKNNILKQFHPDKNSDNEYVDKCKIISQLTNRAFAILNNQN